MRIKLLFIFALLLTAVTGAWADDSGSCGTDVSYSYVESTHTLTISGTGAMTDYASSSERPWDSYVEEIETVIIEDGVTSIGDKAFRGCIGLTTVTIGSGVTYIGTDAFYFCTKVEVVYCNADPAKLTWEEDGCDDFKKDGSTIINVADAAPWIANFTGVVNGTFIDTPYVPLTWNYDADTKTLTFSGTVIPSYGNPEERPWKDYVSEVEKIVISDGVTSIGSGAFYNCSGLTTVIIPAGVTYIGKDAFYLCPKVEVVYCNANPATLTWDESGCDDFKPDGTTIINVADAAPWIAKFTGKVNGTFIDKPYEPLTWNYDADTKTLTISGTAPIPSYENSDERPWKDYVEVVENIVIEDGVTSIGVDAFSYCASLTTVTIPASVTYIGSDAFYDCTKVEVVYCNADPEELTWEEGSCDDFKKDGSTIIHVADADPWIAKFTGEVHGIFSDKPYVPLTWNYDAGTKTLTFSGTEAIPSYSDSDDRPWFNDFPEAEKIVIEDGVLGIGRNAFYSYKDLTSVTIPNSVTNIGKYAFEDCTSLTSITIPASVTNISTHIFEYCNNLTTLTVDSENPVYDSRNNCNAIIETSSNTLVAGCVGTTIPTGVTSIGDDAFYGCTGLMSISIPASVTSIGYYAFEECSSLMSVTVYSQDCTLGNGAFDGCNILETIYVPSDLVDHYKTAWSDYAGIIVGFVGGDCGATVTWKLGSGVLIISGTGAMADYDDPSAQPWKDYRSSITRVVIESGVTTIGKKAFAGCTGLTSVTVYAPDCTLGNGAFDGCNNLEAIYVPSDLVDHYKTAENWSAYASIIMENIISQGYCGAEGHEEDVTWVLKNTSHNYTLTISGTGAMADYNDSSERPWDSYANGIETIVIEDGVTSIGSSAFYDCASLTTVTIPSSVTSIGNYAFENCSGLTTITIPASVTSIGYGVFASCNQLETMMVEAGNKVYDSRNSCNAIIEKESNTLIAGCKNTIIPDDVTNIGNNAFEGCEGLTTVTIPAGVTYIGPDAFFYCTGITDVYCNADPTKLTWDEVGCDDFKEDGSTIIHVADADPWYTKFGGVVNGVFRDPSTIPLTWNYDSDTKTLTFSGKEPIPSYDLDERPWKDYVEEVENIVINEGVRGIGNQAFSGFSGLTTVTIPASVTSIGKYAFNYCSGLTTITIPASVKSIGFYAFNSCTGLTIVTIPAGVTSIGNYAFEGCSGLTTVTIGSGVTYIGYDAFYQCTAVTDVYCYADPDALTWDEDGCDDFMDGKATKCHVTDADTWSAKFGSDVNVDFEDDLAPKAETKVAGAEYWSSYYNTIAHLKADDNTTVYKATLSGTTVTLTEITDKVITAGQAVLLKKTTNDPVELTPCAAASTDDYSGNDLEGVDEDTAKEPSFDYYVLSYKDSKLSFYKYSGTTLGANKAFFKIPANSSREFLDILGEVTGIDGRYKMEDGRSDVYYDLSGRRVMNPTKKGIYIVNGSKVVVK